MVLNGQKRPSGHTGSGERPSPGVLGAQISRDRGARREARSRHGRFASNSTPGFARLPSVAPPGSWFCSGSRGALRHKVCPRRGPEKDCGALPARRTARVRTTTRALRPPARSCRKTPFLPVFPPSAQAAAWSRAWGKRPISAAHPMPVPVSVSSPAPRGPVSSGAAAKLPGPPPVAATRENSRGARGARGPLNRAHTGQLLGDGEACLGHGASFPLRTERLRTEQRAEGGNTLFPLAGQQRESSVRL